MIVALERNTRLHPRNVCFLFEGRSFVNAQVRLQAAGLARALQLRGVRRGTFVACDMENCPSFVLLAIAAGYGGFALVPLNRRLTPAEKSERLDDLERAGYRVMARLDEPAVIGMLREVSDEPSRQTLRHHAERYAAQFSIDDRAVVMFTSGTSGRAKAVELSWRNLTESARAANEHLSVSASDVWQLALPLYHIGGLQVLVRSIEASCAFVLYRRFSPRAVLDDAARYAATHLSVVDKMLQDLLACAEDDETAEGEPEVFGAHARREGTANATGGHQQGEVSGASENAAQALPMRGRHAARAQTAPLHAREEDLGALRRFRALPESASALTGYRCILLGGAAPNPRTLETAVAVGARVYASYGMTETASNIAATLVTADFAGRLDLLPGYEATIVAPDAEGLGQLGVKGPGVSPGYLNARAAFTADGFFLTGDRARIDADGRVQVAERTDDMFVSGGENVYPAEIQRKLLYVPGVTDAYVFGVLDPTWGRRPVALVERSPRTARQAVQRVLRASEERLRDPYGMGEVADAAVMTGAFASVEVSGSATFPALAEDERLAPDASLQRFAEGVGAALEGALSKVYRPDRILAVSEFPRTGIGKVDRAALRRLYEERIQVERVEIFRVSQPFATPVRTAQATLEERESLIVRVTDHEGRVGLGEGVAFPTDWYLPETLDEDVRALEEELIPCVLQGVYAHPRDAMAALLECPAAEKLPLACGALEPALWDLYAQIVGKPLWQLIGGVPGGGIEGAAVAEATVEDGPGAGTSQPQGSVVVSEVAERDASELEPAPECRRAAVRVPGGAVFGIMEPAALVEAVRRAVEAGFARVKVKIAPGQDIEHIRAVRAAFPDLTVMVDANQSYADARDAAAVLDELAKLGVRCVEEPLTPREGEDKRRLFERLSALQELVDVPVCLDESVTSHDDLRLALGFPRLRCYAVKIAKFGGVAPALEFCEWAGRHGVTVWMGGMFDTGISKRLHAAFETLPSVGLPGDLSDTARYFPHDVTEPPFKLDRGWVELNGTGWESGLGCRLNEEVLARITSEHRVYDRQR